MVLPLTCTVYCEAPSGARMPSSESSMRGPNPDALEDRARERLTQIAEGRVSRP